MRPATMMPPTSGTPRVRFAVPPVRLACGVVLRMIEVALERVAIVVPGAIFAPKTACPTASPAVLPILTVAVAVVTPTVLAHTEVHLIGSGADADETP